MTCLHNACVYWIKKDKKCGKHRDRDTCVPVCSHCRWTDRKTGACGNPVKCVYGREA